MNSLCKLLVIIYVYMVILPLGCSNDDFPEGFEDIVVENIISEQQPSFYFTMFFGHCQDQQIAVLDFVEIKTIHSAQYEDKEYELYLRELLFGKLPVAHDKIPCFSLDTGVVNRYNSVEFSDFKGYYWKESSLIGTFLSKETITHENITSVAYFMFRNGYLTENSFSEFGYQCFSYEKLF